jgi:uncharacterized protein
VVVLRSQAWVQDSADLADAATLTLGVLDFDHRMDGAADTEDALASAQRVLEYCGATFRTNKNSAMLVIADGKTLTQARAAARTLAALADVSADNQRLKRFNSEQGEILAKRLDAVQERLPQLVVMAYRHLALLGESEGKAALDRIDLGPARAGASISSRALEYLRNADRLIDKLAPAALLSARFNLLPEQVEALELDKLLAQFARLTRLPKIANPEVLRRCLADGVKQRIFGLASGSDWRADDAVLRFGVDIALDEIEFQPGTWLVRAKIIETLLRTQPASVAPAATQVLDAPRTEVVGDHAGPQGTSKPSSANPRTVRVTVRQVPADKARDLLKVAVLSLHAGSVSTTFDIVITADGGTAGISRETLDLVVREGLRQLGLDADIEIID